MNNRFLGCCVAFLAALATEKATAQLDVRETLRVCHLSAELFTVIGSSPTDVERYLQVLEADNAVRMTLEDAVENLADAREAKRAIMQAPTEGLSPGELGARQAAMQAASQQIAGRVNELDAAIRSVADLLASHMSHGQRGLFQVAQRGNGDAVSPEYWVLEWETREILELGRALQVVTDGRPAPQIVSQAEQVFQVQQARQWLMANLSANRSALEAF